MINAVHFCCMLFVFYTDYVTVTLIKRLAFSYCNPILGSQLVCILCRQLR